MHGTREHRAIMKRIDELNERLIKLEKERSVQKAVGRTPLVRMDPPPPPEKL
jgi:hypothetical protein